MHVSVPDPAGWICPVRKGRSRAPLGCAAEDADGTPRCTLRPASSQRPSGWILGICRLPELNLTFAASDPGKWRMHLC